jgi:polygalacturonase
MTSRLAGSWLAILTLTAAWGLSAEPGARRASAAAGCPWSEAAAIRRRIVPPSFPARELRIDAYGAVGNGVTDATRAIRAAVDACHRAGGGRVTVPAGVFLTGPIHLRSRVELHLAEGARLRFSRDPNDYLPLVLTRFEGVECLNYSPLIYAREQEDIAITGSGVLDGQADEAHWWPWKGARAGEPDQRPDRDRLFALSEAGVPAAERVFGAGHYLRPSFVQPYACRNVLIEGVTLRGSPMWVIHPVLCQNVTVRGVKVMSLGPNNDGCNPESCRDVLIEDSLFDTGDDCIALKSGRNAEGRRLAVPVENVIVQRCRMRAGHGGVVMGSEVSGGARNIFIQDCEMSSPNLERGLRMKTNSVRGGFIENVFLRDVAIGQLAQAALSVDLDYEEGDSGPHTPRIRNIVLERVRSRSSERMLFIRGYERAPICGVTIARSSFDGVRDADLLRGVAGLVLQDVMVNGRRAQTPPNIPDCAP